MLTFYNTNTEDIMVRGRRNSSYRDNVLMERFCGSHEI